MKNLSLLCFALLLLSGCQSPLYEGTIFEPRPYRQELETERMVSQVRQLNDQSVQLLQDQIEVLNRGLNRMEGRLQQLERQAAQQQISHANDGSSVRKQVQQLQEEVQRLRAGQGRLRQEITSDLIARIEKVVEKHQYPAAAPRGSRASSQTASSAAPNAARSGYEHKVERGQTLSEIARGYGTTIRAIMQANRIANPSAIRVGQILFIPDPER